MMSSRIYPIISELKIPIDTRKIQKPQKRSSTGIAISKIQNFQKRLSIVTSKLKKNRKLLSIQWSVAERVQQYKSRTGFYCLLTKSIVYCQNKENLDEASLYRAAGPLDNSVPGPADPTIIDRFSDKTLKSFTFFRLSRKMSRNQERKCRKKLEVTGFFGVCKYGIMRATCLRLILRKIAI